MDLDFNALTQKLVLKPDYSTQITEITFTRPAFGSLSYEETRIFDPSIVLESEYEEYFYSGFSFMFDIINL